MRARPLAFLVALAAVCTGSVSAQIFVSPAGSDTTGTGTAGNPYKTISFAAGEAIAGDTLQLTAGTFGDDEQVVLGGKNLTVVGAGAGVTIIVPHPTLTSMLPSGVPPGTPDVHRVGVTVDGVSRLDMRNLTIDCDFRTPATDRLVGVLFRGGADGTLDGVEIRNARADPLTGAQEPIAVLVRGDNSTDACDVTFRSCSVHDFGKAGIVAVFNASVNVEHCSVQGGGLIPLGGPAQNGIQISNGAVGVLRHNTISDLDYVPGTFAAAGILLFNHGINSRVEGNNIARCEDNVAIFSQPAAVTDTFIRNNKLTQCSNNALRIDGTTRCLVTNNTFHGVNLTFSPVNDTAATGNNWQNNNYSDWSGSGSYTVPGGAIVDPLPRRNCDEFAGTKFVPLGSAAQDVTVANLDGAGELDIAAITAGVSPSLAVALESAGSYVVTTLPFASSNARGVTVVSGEFDGMPGVDLAAITTSTPSTTGENRIYVFANDGVGNFSLLHVQQMPLAAIQPRDMAVGDIDGNGLDDLAVSHIGNALVKGGGVVYRNVSGGTNWTFAGLANLLLECKGIAMGALDPGNGSIDIAITEGDGTNGFVHVYTNDGLGNFSEDPTSPYTIGANPTAAAIMDTDSDGNAEVITTSWEGPLAIQPGTVAVLHNQLPAGMPVQTLPTDVGPLNIGTGNVGFEFDPDTAYTDAMVVNFNAQTMTFFGDFGPTGPAQGGICLAVANPLAVELADMTGDNYQDVVVVDKFVPSLTIRLGRPTARADLFGAGCPGFEGRVPLISTGGNPGVAQQPNPNFGVQLTNARPASAAIYMIGLPTGLLAPCNLLVQSLITIPVPTDAAGSAFIPLPISSAPKLNGVFLVGQMAVLDDQSPFFNLVSFTQGQVLRIGI